MAYPGERFCPCPSPFHVLNQSQGPEPWSWGWQTSKRHNNFWEQIPPLPLLLVHNNYFIHVSLHWLVSWVWTRSFFQHNSRTSNTCVMKKFLYINQMLNCWIALSCNYTFFFPGFRWFGFFPNFKGLQKRLFSKLFLLVRPFKFTWLSFKIYKLLLNCNINIVEFRVKSCHVYYDPFFCFHSCLLA